MKIKSIRKLDPEFTVDIEVENTHTYQLENGMISHNTSSLSLGTSSGIHAFHNDYYIRRLRVGKEESIYKFLSENHPEILEDEFFRPTQQAVISIPQKAPDNAITRQESALELLERVSKVYKNWIVPGHRKGVNKNNVSATVTIKPEEWSDVGSWMWYNRNSFTGLAVLPFNDHTYIQAPFEDITREKYYELVEHIHDINLDKVIETEDNTQLAENLACAGPGGCEI